MLLPPHIGWVQALVDVDQDGDLDVLADARLWLTVPAAAGDANRDGEFNQLDIVAVLQSAKYLTGEPATWSEGDWNNDGLFDQADIVAALQAGNYLQGPYAAEASSPVKPSPRESDVLD